MYFIPRSICVVRKNRRCTRVEEQPISMRIDVIFSVSHQHLLRTSFLRWICTSEISSFFFVLFGIHIDRKPDDSTDGNATSVFNISGRCENNRAAIASTSNSSLEHTHMVEISIEDLPPAYDDAIVKKPHTHKNLADQP